MHHIRQFSMVMISLLIFGCSKNDECTLCGCWISNEELTLQDIKNNAPSMFESPSFDPTDNFFGRLIHEYRVNDVREYFDDEEANNSPWEPYRIVETNGQVLTVEFPKDEFETVRELTLVNNCYSMSVEGVFSEYFCKCGV